MYSGSPSRPWSNQNLRTGPSLPLEQSPTITIEVSTPPAAGMVSASVLVRSTAQLRARHRHRGIRAGAGGEAPEIDFSPFLQAARLLYEGPWVAERYAVEVWELPVRELGTFVAGIAAPLGLGKLELADGRHQTGFICEPCGFGDARDISHFGGWRQYLASG